MVTDVKKFEKINNLSINIFELCFYQDLYDEVKYETSGSVWKYKLIPLDTLVIEIILNSEIDLLIYKGSLCIN